MRACRIRSSIRLCSYTAARRSPNLTDDLTLLIQSISIQDSNTWFASRHGRLQRLANTTNVQACPVPDNPAKWIKLDENWNVFQFMAEPMARCPGCQHYLVVWRTVGDFNSGTGQPAANPGCTSPLLITVGYGNPASAADALTWYAAATANLAHSIPRPVDLPTRTR